MRSRMLDCVERKFADGSIDSPWWELMPQRTGSKLSAWCKMMLCLRNKLSNDLLSNDLRFHFFLLDVDLDSGLTSHIWGLKRKADWPRALVVRINFLEKQYATTVRRIMNDDPVLKSSKYWIGSVIQVVYLKSLLRERPSRMRQLKWPDG